MSPGRSSVSLSALQGSREQRLAVRSGLLSLVLGLALACLLSAAGSAKAAAKTINYEVSRAGTTKANYDQFHYTVDAVLDDPRGWSLNGAVRFKHVSRGGQFTVRLTDPRVVGSYGGCSSYYSCRVERYVMINDNRWRYGTRSYGDEHRCHGPLRTRLYMAVGGRIRALPHRSTEVEQPTPCESSPTSFRRRCTRLTGGPSGGDEHSARLQPSDTASLAARPHCRNLTLT